MADVYDVAEYILRRCGPMTAMKLQKLAYYSQAWHLSWTDHQLFDERIEAWADGPVCPDLFNRHRGSFRVSRIRGGVPEELTEDEQDSVDRVIRFYGGKSPQWLSDLTHAEAPWRQARGSLPARARSSAEITPEAMARYYSSL